MPMLAQCDIQPHNQEEDGLQHSHTESVSRAWDLRLPSLRGPAHSQASLQVAALQTATHAPEIASSDST